jgi:hypothetical protein
MKCTDVLRLKQGLLVEHEPPMRPLANLYNQMVLLQTLLFAGYEMLNFPGAYRHNG